MEIINYVNGQSRQKRFSLPFFQRRGEYSYSTSSYSFYTTELKSFSAKRLKNPVSVKGVLMGIGRGVSAIERFISSNIKNICRVCGILAGAGVITFFVSHIVINKINHTGPLELQVEETSDFEKLNKMMETFALVGVVDYDDSGKLINVSENDVKVPVVYTQPVTYQNYKVRSGDTISGIAKKFGLRNISTLISVNDIGNVRQLCAGQKLKIPSIDGIVYTVKNGDSLASLVKKYNVKLENLVDVNELSSEILIQGQQLFLPGASMDAASLRNAMGELFAMPIRAKFRWSSPYGPRPYPLTGTPSFHTGTDMACPTGTPIHAAMSGKISYTGLSRVYGNYVIIDHGNGYQTLYAHMSKIIATKGQWVSQGTKIGLVGSTGQSTGPHLHFTVYKNGKTIDPMTVLK